MDAKGEVLLTILSSLAQDESRSILENATWGIRKRFERGEVRVNATKFMGYDKDDEGKLIIIPEQAQVVRNIYDLYLDGYSPELIAKRSTRKASRDGRERQIGVQEPFSKCFRMRSTKEMLYFRKSTPLIF
ncbi:recombinase family protein [Streptococcus merionis]|uniref:Prophage LambdaSa04, site-specific recombinase resolvase n=1 Tax=Streptococcus merionis TaxID=400065 RepID=A0A239SUJ3_9STRE|nr:prophage LambdaSa04, site-specific recombinase resolvase [Streptococcus merionis]